jgi:hypothetical protein
MGGPILRLDVAHPSRPPAAVEEMLLEALSAVRNSPVHRALKVIHGYGSSGAGGSTRTVVRNWLARRRGLRAVIEGERYGLLDPETCAMREEIGRVADADLDRANPGVTLVWVK